MHTDVHIVRWSIHCRLFAYDIKLFVMKTLDTVKLCLMSGACWCQLSICRPVVIHKINEFSSVSASSFARNILIRLPCFISNSKCV